MKALVLIGLAMACLGAYCRPIDGCFHGTTRCSGNVAEICDYGGSFHELADCDLVSSQSGAPYLCAFVDETNEDGRVAGHTCMPATAAGDLGGEL